MSTLIVKVITGDDNPDKTVLAEITLTEGGTSHHILNADGKPMLTIEGSPEPPKVEEPAKPKRKRVVKEPAAKAEKPTPKAKAAAKTSQTSSQSPSLPEDASKATVSPTKDTQMAATIVDELTKSIEGHARTKTDLAEVQKQLRDKTTELTAAEAAKTTAEGKVSGLEADVQTEKTRADDAEAEVARLKLEAEAAEKRAEVAEKAVADMDMSTPQWLRHKATSFVTGAVFWCLAVFEGLGQIIVWYGGIIGWCVRALTPRRFRRDTATDPATGATPPATPVTPARVVTTPVTRVPGWDPDPYKDIKERVLAENKARAKAKAKAARGKYFRNWPYIVIGLTAFLLAVTLYIYADLLGSYLAVGGSYLVAGFHYLFG